MGHCGRSSRLQTIHSSVRETSYRYNIVQKRYLNLFPRYIRHREHHISRVEAAYKAMSTIAAPATKLASTPVATLLSLPPSVRTAVYSQAQRRWQSTKSPSHPKTALFFPGQGVQRVGMVPHSPSPKVDRHTHLTPIDDRLARSLPTNREALSRADR